jgi:DNA-binding transcriptional MerR regulator
MTNEENLEEELTENEPADDSAPGTKPEEQLQAIIDAAKNARMTPDDEGRAMELLKQTIPGGPKALPATLDAILTLPWSAGVKAVSDAWPETKPAGRARLIAGLGKSDSDVSRRIRLSLARGLHAQDPATALKLITSVCEAMGGAQGGSSTKDRQIFANVMLGKARPWIMNVSMTEMKPADAQKLITPSLESCAQAPIFTQIWVLRWICDANQFDTLPPEHIESIGKSINRWQARWHKELRKIIPQLPDSLEAALANGPARPPAHAPAPAQEGANEVDSTETGELAAPSDESQSELPLDEDDEDEEDDAPEAEDRRDEPRPAPAPRQQRESQGRGGRDRDRDRDRGQGGPFDLNRSLRDIESYVARLRSELQQAQATARRSDRGDRGDRGGRGRGQQPAASSEDLEEMRRFNAQLEEQNQELRHRIEELTSDHEDRAATLEIDDSLEQFKRFLGLKLKEDFADYNAISREALNEVVRRHAHEILGRIFGVLQGEGVRFDQEG